MAEEKKQVARCRLAWQRCSKVGLIMDVTNARPGKMLKTQGGGGGSGDGTGNASSRYSRQGGVARWADPPTKKIKNNHHRAVSIPVMARYALGLLPRRQILEALGEIYIDEERMLTRQTRDSYYKFAFRCRLWVGTQPGGGPAAYR